ncbi:MAG TPA: polysaccharide biosynthesis protein [Candidatus Enterenecus faecium]|uniref:Polysaccharide biosynthesis protein n=1 Tax=Candidatus Enterenecus faecium TaxID=2840780 RepID=A0A9D0YUH9_9FIRM|nr:polysaccharide biosynthesis protein [Candidatus Enterenecus faecium]
MNWKILIIMLVDTLLMVSSYALALLIRFDFHWSQIPMTYVRSWAPCLIVQLIVTAVVFFWRRMYHYIWRTVNAHDVIRMCVSVVLAFALSNLCCVFLSLPLPASVWVMVFVFQLCGLVGERCALRLWSVVQYSYGRGNKGEERIMLIGAGESGRMLSRELRSSPQVKGRLCCVIDDNPQLHGKYLDGVRIVGGRDQIEDAAKRYDITQILFAIPTIQPEEKAAILNICKMTGCRLRVLPGLYQLLNGEVSLSAVKDVQVEDLLGRSPVQLNKAVVSDFLEEKVVMVTGGGGSIGSELCRQIATCHPRRLIILDIYENNAYDIQQELKRQYGTRLDLRVEICSIRDKKRVYQIFEQYRPDVVFHAAAHKHVPLMEDCPDEAIKNNIFGTYHVVRASEKFGVKKFVMISTDKAVNPTNLMGATKRFCEMILQSRRGSSTEFCAVRFGNVLGSNGSVIPLFKRQIANGGPVTITDKRIIRYFMTIPEAAMLVLEAGAMAKQSQIFVLDMGQPVKILTLAENLIRLSGLEPYKDIEIKEIGLRPGEKLYEELLMQSEHLLTTANDKIFVEEQQVIPQRDIMCGLISLDNFVSAQRPKDELIALMRYLVPTFRDPDEVNREAVERLEGAHEKQAVRA